MPRPRRVPYVPMDATIRSNAKLACLPSDTARLGWIYVGLGDAKLQRPSGCFGSRRHWDEVAGRFSRFLRDYLAVGLLEVAPDLCPRCLAAWPNVADGTLVVHDWKRHNTDPGQREPFPYEDLSDPTPGAERTRWWRLRTAVFTRDGFCCRYCGNPEYDRRHLVVDHIVPVNQGRSDDMENLATACRSCNGRKGGRTPEEAGMVLLPVPSVTDGDDDVTSQTTVTVTGVTRGSDVTLARDPAGPRGVNRKVNQNRENVPSRSKGSAGAQHDEGPLLTRAQLDAWSSFGPEWDGLKAAWLERGLRLPPSGGSDEEGSQRAVLFPIVDAFPSRVAAWVRGAPAGASGREVVGHLIAEYRDATADARAADDDTPSWMGGPSRTAAEALGQIMARVLP